MRRLGAVVGLLLLVGGLTAAPGWSIDTPSRDVLNDPAYRNGTQDRLSDYRTVLPTPGGLNAATGSSYTTQEVQSGMNQARSFGAMYPRISAVLQTLVLSAGGALGWKIGDYAGGFIYKKLTGTTYGGTVSGLTVANVRWLCSGTLQGNACGSSSITGFFASGSFPANWYYNYDGFSSGYYLCLPTTAGPCAALAGTARYQASQMVEALCVKPGVACISEVETGTANGTCAFSHANCTIVSINQESHDALTTNEDSTKAAYDAAALKKDSSAFTVYPFCDAICTVAALKSLGVGSPSVGTPNQEGAGAAIAESLKPGSVTGGATAGQGGAFVPFRLPEPDDGETYTDYANRLRDRGWVGSVTFTDDATSYTGGSAAAAAGAGTVTYVVSSGTTTRVYTSPAGARTAWPVNAPVIASPSVAVTIYRLPGTPPSSGCDCPVDDLELPSGSLAPACDTFPFGGICWIGEQGGTIFGATPEAPHVSMDFAPLETPVGDVDFPAVELDAEDLPEAFGYLFLAIKVALSFLVWLIGLWRLGPGLLGMARPDGGRE